MTRDEAYRRYHRHASRPRVGRPATSEGRVAQLIINAPFTLGIYDITKQAEVSYETAKRAALRLEELGLADVGHDGIRKVVRPATTQGGVQDGRPV